MNSELHSAQLHILNSLRLSERQSFSQLMKPLDTQSDAFKFHIRKLRTLGYITKSTDGTYTLTATGKEVTNTLNRAARQPRKQPKISILVIARRTKNSGDIEYLSQKRYRQPFYGFWGGGISGPVLWGESFEDAAARELKKQTGLTATFTIKLFYRQRDTQNASLLEDKLFVVLEAHNLHGEVSNRWHNGENAWLTMAELESKSHYFAAHREIIQAIQNQQNYLTRTTDYSPDEY